MIEAPSFYENLTGKENVKIIAELYGKEAKDRVDTVLNMVELEGAADKKVCQYSLGMKQRLGIARAFIQHKNRYLDKLYGLVSFIILRSKWKMPNKTVWARLCGILRHSFYKFAYHV